MRLRRLVDGPIISPASHVSIGNNVNGPSLIRVPEWVERPLATYYLYFAHHHGDHIRLAVADRLDGPWTVHPGGVLGLQDSGFLASPPSASTVEIDRAVDWMREALGDDRDRDAIADDLLVPHIASPDVRIDGARRRFEMAFHGLAGPGLQLTRLAHAANGLDFVVDPTPIDGVYMRAFAHGGFDYALAMPGRVHRRVGPAAFEPGPDLLPVRARHAAVRVVGDQLQVLWTRVGDAPERLLESRVDLTQPWKRWRARPANEVARPERPWEGAELPVARSARGAAPGPVHQLRDPAVLEDGGRTFVVYAIAGESGLGIGELID